MLDDLESHYALAWLNGARSLQLIANRKLHISFQMTS